jgi:hypothetical protein
LLGFLTFLGVSAPLLTDSDIPRFRPRFGLNVPRYRTHLGTLFRRKNRWLP